MDEVLSLPPICLWKMNENRGNGRDTGPTGKSFLEMKCWMDAMDKSSSLYQYDLRN